MPKPKISASAQRVLDQIKAKKQEEKRKQREAERAEARAKEPPKPYFASEAVKPQPWEPRPKPPQDPKGKFKCGHCGDRCSKVIKHFVGRVNKQKKHLYWLLCPYCNYCFYGNYKDFLPTPGVEYPDNETVLAAARARGQIEQYVHKNLVTFKDR